MERSNGSTEGIMHCMAWRTAFALLFMASGIFAAGPVLAEKPAWAGGEKGASQKPGPQGPAAGATGPGGKGGAFFQERHRVVVQDYIAGQYGKGRCPPGLAKKRNGCMPPGQAKKWAIGRPLPRDVIFYDLPPAVLMQLGSPPSRHRFVRVAQDILLLASGTGMVVDAIENLNWEFSR
jgi:hypothetical protein